MCLLINDILWHDVTENRSSPSPNFGWGKADTSLQWLVWASERRAWLRRHPILGCAQIPFAAPKALPEVTFPTRRTQNTWAFDCIPDCSCAGPRGSYVSATSGRFRGDTFSRKYLNTDAKYMLFRVTRSSKRNMWYS